MKFVSREATEAERLNVDEEAESLPAGVFAVDFGEYGVLCGLGVGEHVIDMEGVAGFTDGSWVVQVTTHEDSAFIKKLEFTD